MPVPTVGVPKIYGENTYRGDLSAQCMAEIFGLSNEARAQLIEIRADVCPGAWVRGYAKATRKSRFLQLRKILAHILDQNNSDSNGL